MARDFYSENSYTQLLDPAALATDANTSSLNLAGYDSATILVLVGQHADEDSLSSTYKIEFELEESSDDSTYTDVDDADIIGEVSGTNSGCFGVIDVSTEDDAMFTVHYIGGKQYVRAVMNFTGTQVTGPPIGVAGIRNSYKYPPTS